MPTAMLAAACEDHELVVEAEVGRESACYGFSHLTNFVRIGIDSCFLIGEEKIFLSGWILDPDRRIHSLRVRSGVWHSRDIREGRNAIHVPTSKRCFARTYLAVSVNLGFRPSWTSRFQKNGLEAWNSSCWQNLAR